MIRKMSTSTVAALISVLLLPGCDAPYWNGSATGPTPEEEKELISLWEKSVTPNGLNTEESARLIKLAYTLLPDLNSVGLDKLRWFVYRTDRGHDPRGGTLWVAVWLTSEFDSPNGTAIVGPRMSFPMTYAPVKSHEGFISWKPGSPIPPMFGSELVAGHVEVRGPREIKREVTRAIADSLMSKVRFDILSRVGLASREAVDVDDYQ